MKSQSGFDKPLTMTGLARLLGVTAATVSNAYNRPEKLSPELRQRILSAADQHGYAGPNPVWASLRRQRVGAIGWIAPNSLTQVTSDPAMLPFFQGMATELEDLGRGFTFISSLGQESRDAELVRNAIVDGFIYTSTRDDSLLAAVRARNTPVVVVEQPIVDDVPSVLIDNRSGTKSAAEHLLSRGHRHFAIASLRRRKDSTIGPVGRGEMDDTDYTITADRFAGYADAFSHHGVELGEVPVYEPETSRAGGKEAGQWFFSQTPRPTAVLAMSDTMALGIVDAAAELGLRVPHDVAVVGFDDIDEAATSGLSTVRQPLREKGAMAVRMLLDPDAFDTTHVTLNTELVVRNTSASREPDLRA